MTRDTSRTTYERIIAAGLLARIKLEVYCYLYEHGPLTGRELDRGLAREGETRTSYHKRLPELRGLGVVREKSVRMCRVSGEKAIEWDVTSMLPAPSPKPPPPIVPPPSAIHDLVNLCHEMMAVVEAGNPLHASYFRRRLAALGVPS